VRLPTPQSAETGSGRRNASFSPTGTTTIASGFAMPDASLATNLTSATPTEQLSPCSAVTRRRISAPMRPGVVSSRRSAPRTSRKASSKLRGSTKGVNSWKIAMTPRDTSP
jgi:hypothetical protein